MRAWFSGRMKRRNRSASGIKKNPPNFLLHLLVSPLWMLATHTGPFYFTSHPIQLLRLLQSLRSRHLSVDLHLFRARPFVKQHAISLRHDRFSSKTVGLRAKLSIDEPLGNVYSSLFETMSSNGSSASELAVARELSPRRSTSAATDIDGLVTEQLAH